jgi:AcrR family transcriptional regulator
MKVVEKAKRRKQGDRREESGRKLVQAAVALMAEGGVSSATFQAIGARSGYSASLVTERFGAKRGLTEATIQYLQEGLDHLFEQVERKRLSGLAAVLRYIELWLVQMAEHPERRAYFMLLASAVSDPSDYRPIFAAGHEHVRNRLTGFIKRGQEDGSIRKDLDCAAAALFVGSLQLGLSMQLLVDPAMPLKALGETVRQVLQQSFGAI